MEKIVAKWLDTEKPNAWDWAVFGIVFAMSCLLFCYAYDLVTTAKYSMVFMSSLFRGEWLDFYTIAHEANVWAPLPHANYNVFIYFILGSFFLPLQLMANLFQVEFSDLVIIMYGKLILSFWMGIAAFLFHKLARNLISSENNAKWALYFLLSSPVFLFGTILFGGYDILSIVFTLGALLFYSQKKYWLFSLMMIPAINCKAFALFLMLPLILLVEKRLYKICLHVLCAMSGLFATGLLYRNDRGYQAAQQWAEERFGFVLRFFYGNFFGQELSMFLLLFLLICIACYIMPFDETKLNLYLVAIPVLTYSCFLGFYYPAHAQWFVLLSPYLALLILQLRNRKVALLAESFFAIGFLINTVIQFSDVSNNQINYGILPLIFGKKYEGPGFVEFARDLFAYDPSWISRTLLISSMIVIVALAGYQFFEKNDHMEQPVAVERGLIWLRPAILLGLFMVPSIVLYFIY